MANATPEGLTTEAVPNLPNTPPDPGAVTPAPTEAPPALDPEARVEAATAAFLATRANTRTSRTASASAVSATAQQQTVVDTEQAKLASLKEVQSAAHVADVTAFHVEEAALTELTSAFAALKDTDNPGA